jgi:hypothetical protein
LHLLAHQLLFFLVRPLLVSSLRDVETEQPLRPQERYGKTVGQTSRLDGVEAFKRWDFV